MPQYCPAEPVVAVTRLPEPATDVFVNTQLVIPFLAVIPFSSIDLSGSIDCPFETPGAKARSVFGGYLLGQCVAAAQQTVPATHDVHSLQSTFLLPGNPNEKVAYHVERLSDGRSFSSRLVRAIQGGNIVHFTAIVGFQKRSSSDDDVVAVAPKLNYHEAMPQFGHGDPDDVDADSAQACLVEGGYPREMLDIWRDPFQWRILPRDRQIGQPDTSSLDPPRFRMQSFVRVHPSTLTTAAPRATHHALLAFLSDLFLIYTTNLAAARPVTAFSIETTMNHSVWFHAPDARLDDWLACERDTLMG
ncbi:thioesterase-like superfamily-domain-containing protein [Apiospora marii]|uniref:Thioesterase-like superfamily-domain-containing protein n=1 Tax=Apiospora marii TaxID=335849 RepID=A0ABR1T1G1_9PEZI